MNFGLFAAFVGIALGLILVVGVLILILKEVRRLRKATLGNKNANNRYPK